jgi:peptidoglycan hydrolase FlgJ
MDSVSSLNNGMSSIDASKDIRAKELIGKAQNLSKDFAKELDSAVASKSKDHKSDYEIAKEKKSKKLMDTCVEAESLLVGQMLKKMRSTVEKGDLINGGQTEEIFTDMLYDQYALTMSKTANFGIAKQMYNQLSKSM